MSNDNRSRLRLTWDSLVSTFSLVFARLAPNIRVPHKDLTGKVAVVTGANSGLGYSLAASLAQRNATVYLACRSMERGEKAAQDILAAAKDVNSKNIRVVQLDTSSLKSVRDFPSQLFSRHQEAGIDILIHNAGISSAPAGKEVTEEGFGTIYATNFLGSFLLTSLLEERLNQNARVIFTSSTGNYGGKPDRLFSLLKMAPSKKKEPDSMLYSDTKAFQVVFARMLQDRFDDKFPNKNIISHSFTPGYTMTPIFGKMDAERRTDPLFWALKVGTALAIPVEQGAATGLWLATTDDEKVVGQGMGGRYWDRCVQRLSPIQLISEEKKQKMWRIWEQDSGAEWS